MAELDLVPAAYRRRRSARRLLRRFTVAEIGALLAVAAVKAALATGVDARTSAVQRIQADQQIAIQRDARIQTLEAGNAALRSRIALLDQLRGGPRVMDVFAGIDRAIGPEVWFRRWTFRRAGEFVEAEPRAVQTGYILVVPEGAETNGKKRTWRVGTHMEIEGQAVDHTGLARFVDRLGREPQVAEVKVLSTRSRQYTDSRVVDFEVAVVMRGAGEGA